MMSVHQYKSLRRRNIGINEQVATEWTRFTCLSTGPRCSCRMNGRLHLNVYRFSCKHQHCVTFRAKASSRWTTSLINRNLAGTSDWSLSHLRCKQKLYEINPWRGLLFSSNFSKGSRSQPHYLPVCCIPYDSFYGLLIIRGLMMA